jgi:cholesterol transport system auxiliary component
MGQERLTTRRGILLAPFVGPAALVAGCARPVRETFDLAMARGVGRVSIGGLAIGVREPMATPPTSSERVVVRDVDGSVSVLPGAQWSAPLSPLLRERIIEALRSRGVAAARISGGSSRALAIDVRRFEIDAARNVAVVEFAAFMVDETDGATRAARSFWVEKPAPEHLDARAAGVLAEASSEALARLAEWTRGRQ